MAARAVLRKGGARAKRVVVGGRAAAAQILSPWRILRRIGAPAFDQLRQIGGAFLCRVRRSVLLSDRDFDRTLRLASDDRLNVPDPLLVKFADVDEDRVSAVDLDESAPSRDVRRTERRRFRNATIFFTQRRQRPPAIVSLWSRLPRRSPSDEDRNRARGC